MTETKIEEFILQITAQLAAMNENLKTALDRLMTHEQRITSLEQGKVSLKDATIQWLVKGIIASILIIGSLTGSSALIQRILAPNLTTTTQTANGAK